MASEAQIQANRANAQKSTGPRTPEGKAVASQNAVTHGFLARETVIPGEDAGEFALYRDWKLRDLAPVGDAELDMAERIVGLSWRLRRAERLQTEAFDALYEKMATGAPGGGMSAECVSEPGPGTAGGAESDADRLLGRMLVDDFSNSRVLERLLLYERRIENSLYRSLRELREQKRMRLADALVEPVGRVPAGASRGTGIPSVSLSGQALPVSWDHGRDAHATHGQDRDPKRDLSRLGTHAHATATPAGVTANLLAAVQSLCKTNPIGEGIRVQGSGISDLILGLSCETKPICGRIGVQGARASDLTPDPRPPTPERLCETKPISRGDSSAPAAVRRVA